MSKPIPDQKASYLLNPETVEVLDLMGPQIKILVLPEEDQSAPCVMRGTIPPGGIIPLHSHSDPETFLAVSGEVEGLIQSGDEFRWVRIRAGDVFHVPGGAKHAFRNHGNEPYVSTIVSTPKMGRFLRDIGLALAAGEFPSAPPDERIQSFLATSEKYGYWNGSPADNAEIGLLLFPE